MNLEGLSATQRLVLNIAVERGEAGVSVSELIDEFADTPDPPPRITVYTSLKALHERGVLEPATRSGPLDRAGRRSARYRLVGTRDDVLRALLQQLLFGAFGGDVAKLRSMLPEVSLHAESAD